MTNSPTAGMNTSIEPAMTPGIDSGSVICRKARNGVAPRSTAASSSVLSCFSRFEYSGRIMNGRYEYTMPMYIAKSVCIITMGSSMMPSAISTLLISAVVAQQADPRIHAHEERRPERQDDQQQQRCCASSAFARAMP